jgi:hypothetical protein
VLGYLFECGYVTFCPTGFPRLALALRFCPATPSALDYKANFLYELGKH